MFSFFCRLRHSSILRRGAAVLLALAWTSPAFCGSAQTTAPAALASTTTQPPADELVDNPEYKHWASFKPGACVKTVNTYDQAFRGDPPGLAISVTSTITTTKTLKEVGPDKVTVEVVKELETGGQRRSIPAKTDEIPAKVDKGKLDPAPKGYKVTKVEGDEEIAVGGKTYKTHWVEYTLVSETPAKLPDTRDKIWTSDQVPGGMIKEIIEVKDGDKEKIELAEFKAAS